LRVEKEGRKKTHFLLTSSLGLSDTSSPQHVGGGGGGGTTRCARTYSGTRSSSSSNLCPPRARGSSWSLILLLPPVPPCLMSSRCFSTASLREHSPSPARHFFSPPPSSQREHREANHSAEQGLKASSGWRRSTGAKAATSERSRSRFGSDGGGARVLGGGAGGFGGVSVSCCCFFFVAVAADALSFVAVAIVCVRERSGEVRKKEKKNRVSPPSTEMGAPRSFLARLGSSSLPCFPGSRPRTCRALPCSTA
jgi:hypothetical protein